MQIFLVFGMKLESRKIKKVINPDFFKNILMGQSGPKMVQNQGVFFRGGGLTIHSYFLFFLNMGEKVRNVF